MTLALLTIGAASRLSAQDGGTDPLAAALQTAFRTRFAVSHENGGRILRILVDATASEEMALRVAQFVRTHDDSLSSIDAIDVRFWRNEQNGLVGRTTITRTATFLPATLPTDTTPGWAQTMLAPPQLPALATSRLEPSTDTVGSTIESVRDTTVDGRLLWLVANQARYTNTVTVDRSTVRPVDERFTDLAGNTVTAHYDGARLALTLLNGPGNRFVAKRDTVLAAAPFSLQELDVLLKCLPLTQGYTTRLPVFNAHSYGSHLDWVTILVTGIDSARHAWIVDAAGTGTVAFSRHWIAQ